MSFLNTKFNDKNFPSRDKDFSKNEIKSKKDSNKSEPEMKN